MTVIWKWNETDTTEFGTPIIVLGQLTGTLQFEVIPAFQTSSVFEPRLRLKYNDFHISGGLIGGAYSASALIPINIPVDLPKRYSISLDVWHMSGTANMKYGFVFGASSGTNGVFGTGISRKIRQAAENLRTIAFNGTNKMSTETSMGCNEILSAVTNSVTSHKITIELNSLTATVSGSSWKLSGRTYYEQRTGTPFSYVHNINSKNLALNALHDTYGNWTGESNLTKLYFLVQNPDPVAGDTATLNISNLFIEKHPADES